MRQTLPPKPARINRHVGVLAKFLVDWLTATGQCATLIDMERHGEWVMEPAESSARWPVMDSKARGQAIKKRRLAHGIRSIHAFNRATKVSREAITAAENGTASDDTYDRLEAWLDRFETEISDESVTEAAAAMIEFEVSGDFGVRVVVRGPISDADAVERSAAQLVRDIRDKRGQDESQSGNR